MERRLVAILAADVVGYSRLMGIDEAATLQRLKLLHKELVHPKITKRNGRIVKLMGDGLLAEFPSVVQAVQCAVDIQRDTAVRESDIAEDQRIRLRIGINLGDVMVEGTDLYGDGVNIAARLEALAQPDGICLSDDAYRQAKGKIDVAFEDLGEQQLKNIAEPLRVYQVVGGQSGVAATSPHPEALGLPERPSIAVLPFEELGGSETHTDFSDGLAADLITGFSRLGTIAVAGRHESQNQALLGASIQEVGRLLTARYVLSGTIRRAGERVRITAELLEVSTGRPRWSERYDWSLNDPFAVQDEVSRAIVGVVEPILHRAEMDRISRISAETLQPNELMLRAWRLSDKGYEDGNRAAQRDCEEAARRDPEYSDAYSQLSWILWYDAINGWTDDPEGTLRRALECAEQGWSLNPKDYDALGARGATLIALGRYEATAQIIEDLARKFPGHGHATIYRGEFLSSLGRHDEAFDFVQQSIDINPEHDQWHWMYKGFCLFCLERFGEAIDALEQFKTLSKFPFPRLVLAAAYAAAGRADDARAEIQSLDVDPGKLIKGVSFLYRETADRERLIRWAERAGLPRPSP